eukprot:6552182-Pyramimonas_sp.AAC.1
MACNSSIVSERNGVIPRALSNSGLRWRVIVSISVRQKTVGRPSAGIRSNSNWPMSGTASGTSGR